MISFAYVSSFVGFSTLVSGYGLFLPQRITNDGEKESIWLENKGKHIFEVQKIIVIV